MDEATKRQKQQERVVKSAVDGMLGPNPFAGFDLNDVMDSARMVAGEALRQPGLFASHQFRIAKDVLKAVTGDSDMEAPKKDRRFQDKQWSENEGWRRLMQSYLTWANGLEDWVEETGLSPMQEARGKFVVNLLTDGLSPSNNPLTNPTALRRARQTKGLSLVRGLKNLAGDMVNNGGLPSQVDGSAFQVGRNIASTKGAVVYRNELLELIEYNATTDKVRQIPLMIVPPQINKYYVFDLSPEKSLIKHAVDNGTRVFTISWRNPTAAQRDWGLEQYLDAIIDGMKAIEDITGEKKVNILGACSGGMTVATLLSVLAQTRQSRVNSLTLMVCVLDTSGAEDTTLGLFATDETLNAAKALSATSGVLEGREMARIFAWLRPNDLIWNYWVNNYLLGENPPAFDILYWNSDTTRLPAKLHGEFIDLFMLNPMANPGVWTIKGKKIDLGKVKCDSFVVAGTTDHITPWKACYQTVKLLGGKTEFVLSNSGHIQSILNPPTNKKAQYLVNADHPESADDFAAGATVVDESWWLRWTDWLHQRSGSELAAPEGPGCPKHLATDPAPGIYVLED